ncbi:hypothetical protein KIPB_003464 [Kipferlia bialata]|uniref:Uncharacterized protein n=1 Tax=Kipferlia bialata TaxID=797122 RepID=A0A9K3GH33_9EUKA|nr:hypothetical protein KIPB_003464 [Kipferlia bialata]|eukprot:g3464.t1
MDVQDGDTYWERKVTLTQTGDVGLGKHRRISGACVIGGLVYYWVSPWGKKPAGQTVETGLYSCQLDTEDFLAYRPRQLYPIRARPVCVTQTATNDTLQLLELDMDSKWVEGDHIRPPLAPEFGAYRRTPTLSCVFPPFGDCIVFTQATREVYDKSGLSQSQVLAPNHEILSVLDTVSAEVHHLPRALSFYCNEPVYLSPGKYLVRIRHPDTDGMYGYYICTLNPDFKRQCRGLFM